MDTNKISEQVKKNMNSLQEVIHNNEVLKEKVTFLEYKLEKILDELELLKKNNTENNISDCL